MTVYPTRVLDYSGEAIVMALEAKNSSSSLIRSWRTSFLSLRDEIQALPSLQSSRPAIVLELLNHHIFSQLDNLIAAAQKMPHQEVIIVICYIYTFFLTSFNRISFVTFGLLLNLETYEKKKKWEVRVEWKRGLIIWHFCGF